MRMKSKLYFVWEWMNRKEISFLEFIFLGIIGAIIRPVTNVIAQYIPDGISISVTGLTILLFIFYLIRRFYEE